MNDSYKLQLIRLGGILADKKPVDSTKFRDARLRQIVEALAHKDVSPLKKFLSENGCEWNGNGGAIKAVEQFIEVDAEYGRAMDCAKEVFPGWIRPVGTKREVIKHVREVCTAEQLNKWGL